MKKKLKKTIGIVLACTMLFSFLHLRAEELSPVESDHKEDLTDVLLPEDFEESLFEDYSDEEEEIVAETIVDDEDLELQEEELPEKEENAFAEEILLKDSSDPVELEEDAQEMQLQTFDEGECGKTVFWELDHANCLHIFGDGAMNGYSIEDPAPWAEYVGQIKEAVLYEGVTKIGKYAFNGMTELKQVSLSGSISFIEKGAFRDCTLLDSILISDNNCDFIVLDNVLYTADFSELIYYPQSIQSSSFTVPSTVTHIWEYAFYGQDFLEELCLPSVEISIGANAFAECTALSDIRLKEA